jgi:hypothetical protein
MSRCGHFPALEQPEPGSDLHDLYAWIAGERDRRPTGSRVAHLPTEMLQVLRTAIPSTRRQRHHRLRKSSGRAPGRNPTWSNTIMASGNPPARASGMCASLPKVTAFPPSCRHHSGIHSSNRRVFVSNARLEAAMARIA